MQQHMMEKILEQQCIPSHTALQKIDAIFLQRFSKYCLLFEVDSHQNEIGVHKMIVAGFYLPLQFPPH